MPSPVPGAAVAHLPASFQDGFDAVVVWSPEKAYFFKGDKYVRFDIATEAPDHGYPADIAAAFPDVASL